MPLIKLKDFLSEQSTQDKVKDLQAKTTIEKEIMEIDKRLSDIELALANLAKREKDGSLKRSESLGQQAIELQKKVSEFQKKSQAVKKLESLEK